MSNPSPAASGTTFPNTWTDKLFSGLIWPAIAGNIAWSFISVLLYPLPVVGASPDWRIVGRLVTLGLLAVYLMLAWEPDGPQYNRKKAYYWLDGLSALGFVIFSLAAYFDTNPELGYGWLLTITLTTIFWIIGGGHFCKIWAPFSDAWRRKLLGALNIIGGIIVLFSHLGGCQSLYGARIVAIVIVVVPWFFLRRKDPKAGSPQAAKAVAAPPTAGAPGAETVSAPAEQKKPEVLPPAAQ